MDLKQIRYFVTVVEEGSINTAARKLHMTQPPVSKQMQLLEAELGCTLFLRGSRPLELTPEGKVLYERGVSLLAMAQGTAQAVAECRKGGTLRLGLVSSVSEMAAKRWIAPFSRRHPGISFELYEANTYQLLEQLRTRAFDLALVRTPFASRGLSCCVLPPKPMLAVWRPGSFPLSASPLPLEQLAEVPLVLYRRWEHLVEEAFSRVGLRPTVLVRDESARTCLALAEAGMGVAIEPDSMGEPARGAGLQACPIDAPVLHSSIALVSGEGGCDTAAGRAFWDFFRQTAVGQTGDTSPSP